MTPLNVRTFIWFVNYKHSRNRIDALLEEHVDQTPQATHSKIVLEANKDLVGEFLLRNDSDHYQLLSLEELQPVFLSLQGVEFPPPSNHSYHFQILT